MKLTVGAELLMVGILDRDEVSQEDRDCLDKYEATGRYLSMQRTLQNRERLNRPQKPIDESPQKPIKTHWLNRERVIGEIVEIAWGDFICSTPKEYPDEGPVSNKQIAIAR